MKKFMHWAMAATLICGASVFTACSSDDDDNNSGNNEKKLSQNRQEFVEHTRASLKGVAENLNFTTINSVSFMNTYLNQYILLNDDFDKAISRAFDEMIQATPWLMPDDRPERPPRYKYEASVGLTDFNYTFSATTTGFDMAENDGQGLVVEFPVYGTTEAEGVKIAIKGTGDTYAQSVNRLYNDSVHVIVYLPTQYNLSLSVKANGKWTEYLYGTIKNTLEVSSSLETLYSGTPFKVSARFAALDLHSNIPDVDATDIYFALNQDPETHKAGMKIDYTHNGYQVLNATATMANANGMTDLSQITSSTCIMDVMTAIMAGNSIEDMTITLLGCLTTNVKVSDCEKVVKLQNAMAKARRNYADEATIDGYVSQLNQLITCSMSDKTLSQQIPMRLTTTKVGVDYWAVLALKFADETDYVPLTEVLDQQSVVYGINIVDHAVDPAKNAIIVARQLMQAMQKLQNAFYDSKEAAK